ncbi:uncharacterized protein [Palaemon carinicauda]|uniref:uncharacterized protein n=1 Tax=Palaemon carinicauda TaxID=392227 RepID=UPI0035B577A9
MGGRGHFRISPLWVLSMIWGLCSWTEGLGEVVQINAGSDYCDENDKARTVTCDLQNQRGIMLESTWSERNAFSIINGTSLTIQQQCDAEEKYLDITNTKNIRSGRIIKGNVQNNNNCQVGLRLFKCTATTLERLFSIIYITQSSVDAVKLIVKHFHLDNSSVGDVDIVSTSQGSTIKDSKVDTITRLEIHGDYGLDIVQSRIGKVRKFLFNSKDKNVSISDTVVDKVFAEGFEMKAGNLILTTVTFKRLSSGSFVIDSGYMHFENVRIDVAYGDSIIMKGTTKITFQNVSIGGHFKEQYFEIENTGNQELWPLAAVMSLNSSLSVPESVMIGIGTIIIIIILTMIVGIMIKLKLKNTVSSSVNTEQSELNYVSNHDSSSHSTKMNSQPYITQHETSAHSKEISDIFEGDYEYTDVELPLPPPPLMPPVNNMPESNELKSQLTDSWPPAPPRSRFANDSRLTDDDSNTHDTCKDYLEPIPSVLDPNPHLPPDRKQNILNQEQKPDIAHRNPLIMPKPSAKSFLHVKQKPPAPAKPTSHREPLVNPHEEPPSMLPGKLNIHKIRGRFEKLPHPPQISTENPRFADNMEDPEEIYESFPE